MKPICFDDIVIEIAIIRPGPVIGHMVHPFLRRRAGIEPVTYLHPSLEPVLRETLGVILFQEQAVRIAMVAADFSAGEADLLRRALSRSDAQVVEGPLRERFVHGALAKGIERETAAAIFAHLAGFAGFGFCKSHAASFALISYQTMYLKCYYPTAFYAALLNMQPMGFYSVEVVINDMKRHGIQLLPPDMNQSDWGYLIAGAHQLRMGLSTITGLGEQGWKRIKSARDEHDFTDLRDFCIRARLPEATMSDLIRAGALDAWGARRKLLWELGEIDYRPEELPLETVPLPVELPGLEPFEKTLWEYALMGLSAGGQLMRHYRAALNRAGILSTGEVKQRANGQAVRLAGMAVVKQSPATAHGVVFISLEDEYGLLDLIVKPEIYQAYRAQLRGHPFISVEGTVQKASGVISVLVTRALEWSR